MKRIWVAAVLLSGCSLFDSLDVVYEPEMLDSGDVAGDFQGQFDADIAVNDMGDFGSDMPRDTAADLSEDADRCVLDFPRVNLASGGVCTTFPPITKTASCEVVKQNGCPADSYCAVTFNGMGLATNCLDYDDPCNFIARGETCIARQEDGSILQLGVCYPGGTCRALKGGEDTTACVGYCQLATGLGCESEEFCTPFDTDMSAVGVGRCEGPSANCR